MSTLAPHHRTGVRIRRAASLVLSIPSGAVALANLILLAGPWSIFTDGTFGMPPSLAFLVNSLDYTPIAAIAAVILAGTARVPPMPDAPAVASFSPRLPMIVAIIACCLIAAYYAVPALLITVSLVIGGVSVLISST